MATEAVEVELLERKEELGLSTGLLSSVPSGSGAALVIDGSAGIGKSALIRVVRAQAMRTGFSVLSARGTELERDFSFGVTRQLLEPPLAAALPADRDALLAGAARHAEPAVGDVEAAGGEPTPGLDPSFAVLHGLFWLVSNLAERSPLLVAVDDVQWSDSASLRFLAYLTGRLEGLPVLVMLGTRTGEEAPARLIAAVRAEQASHIVRLKPLSGSASAEFVRRRLGPAPDAEFAAAAHRLTGGNPQFLRELLAALTGEGLEATDAGVEAVAAQQADRIAGPVLSRLGRLGDRAVALGRAVAILGGEAPLPLAATLAGIETDEAEMAARALVGAEILRPGGDLAFTHDIGRAAIYNDISRSARAEGHRSAAALVSERGAGHEAVAAHVVARPPEGDETAVVQLVAAAGSARARGAPEAVISYLERALEEDPAPEVRCEILIELGRALTIRRDQRGAAKRLYQALELARAPEQRAEIAHQLVLVLGVSSAAGRAVEILERELAALPDHDRDIGLRLESDIGSTRFFSLTARRAAAGHVRRFDDPDDPRMLANAAMEAALYEGDAGRASALASRAVAGGRLLGDEGPDSPAVWNAGWALAYSHDLGEALQNADEWIEDARRNGSLRAFSLTSLLRSRIEFWRGDLAGAEADARSFRAGMPRAIGAGPAFLADPLIEQGRLDVAADALVAVGEVRDRVGWSFFLPMYLVTSGVLAVRTGSPETGLERLLEAGRVVDDWEVATPAAVQWRPAAAEALAALGDPDRARELIAAEVESCEAYRSPSAPTRS